MEFCPPIPLSVIPTPVEYTLAPAECRREYVSLMIQSAKAGEVELEIALQKPEFKEKITLQVPEDLPFLSENLESIKHCHEQVSTMLQELQALGYSQLETLEARRTKSDQLLYFLSLQDGTQAVYAADENRWHLAPLRHPKAEAAGNIPAILEGLAAITQACQDSPELREHLMQRDKAAGYLDVLRSIRLVAPDKPMLLEFNYDKGYRTTSSQQLHFTWDGEKQILRKLDKEQESFFQYGKSEHP